MSYEERLNKIRNRHMTVDKSYPEYIEREEIVGRKLINPIKYEDIKNDVVVQIDGTSTPDGSHRTPTVYKNIKTNQYYLTYNNDEMYQNNVIDITDVFDWDKVLECGKLKKEFIIKNIDYISEIKQKVLYRPGSLLYDRTYPPINGNCVADM